MGLSKKRAADDKTPTLKKAPAVIAALEPSPPGSPKADDGVDMFTSLLDGPLPAAAKRFRGASGSIGGGTTSCHALVLSSSFKKMQGPNGSFFKLQISALPYAFFGGDKSADAIIVDGVPGESYIIPTEKIDDESPKPDAVPGMPGSIDAMAAAAAANGKAGGKKPKGTLIKRRLEVPAGDGTSFGFLSAISSSFSIDLPGEMTPDGKVVPREPTDRDLTVHPGDHVEIFGISGKLGTHTNSYNNQTTPTVWVNAAKVTRLTKETAPSVVNLPAHMIATFQTEPFATWGAFAASTPTNGFFDHTGYTPEQVEQATVVNELWERLHAGLVSRLSTLATETEEKMPTTSGVFSQHGRRLENGTAADLAAGTLDCLPMGPNDYRMAPLAQTGMTPWAPRPLLMQKLLAGGAEAATLPSSFCTPRVISVAFQGLAATVQAQVIFVYDTRKALDAREQLGGKAQAMLASREAAVGISLSKRDLGVRLGTRDSAKIETIFTEIAKTMEFAAVMPVFNVQSSSFGGSLRTEFSPGNSFYLDVPATLLKAGILVSQSFVEKNVCGAVGTTHYNRPPTQAEAKLVDFPSGVSSVADIQSHGFRELTSLAGFDLKHIAAPEGYTLQYRVVVDGVFDALAGNPSLASSASDGEEHVQAMAAEKMGGNVGALLHSGGVYAVYAKA